MWKFAITFDAFWYTGTLHDKLSFNVQNMDQRRHVAWKARADDRWKWNRLEGRAVRNLASDVVFVGKTYCKIVKMFFQPKSNASLITQPKVNWTRKIKRLSEGTFFGTFKSALFVGGLNYPPLAFPSNWILNPPAQCLFSFYIFK